MNSKTAKESSIDRAFSKIRKEQRIALMPFLMAGDPDLNTTAGILLKLQEKGADMIELGIPYSDPLADGPIIQLAASRALSSGTSPDLVFEMLTTLKDKLSIPIILFTYSNPLLNRGMEKFCDDALEAGVSGFVVPDLPLEEANRFSEIASSKGIDLILLVAPTTPQERMRKIVDSSRGFTYLVSVTGVTGERLVIGDRVKSMLEKLKLISNKPVAVGFGISDPDHIQQVKGFGADGAIVGSALVKKIANAADGNEIEAAGKFCEELSYKV